MIERIKKVRKIIEDLENQHIGVLNIKIVYELDCQLEETLSDEDYCKLYTEIEWAYLKLEGVGLDSIVRCALDHKKDILNDNEDFDLREEACWYE